MMNTKTLFQLLEVGLFLTNIHKVSNVQVTKIHIRRKRQNILEFVNKYFKLNV